jgi:membrane fusion protein (multidrug efflux system)
MNGNRLRIVIIVGVVAVAAALVWLAYHLLVGRYAQSTDDAYVQGDRIALSAQESGTAVAVNTANTQFVRQGQVLVVLDQSDAKLALAEAEAKLGSTLRSVSGLFNLVAADRAGVDSAEATLLQVEQDLERARKLAPIQGVSKGDLQHAEAAYKTASDALAKAQNQLKADSARVLGTTVQTNPDVKLAEAQLRAAWLALVRTEIRAPVSGYVSQNNVEPGDQVSPSMSLMTIVPMDHVWVEANYKETELAGMRIGQPVTLTADMYGSAVTFHGRLLGLSAGTGSAFSLLPPENASGNWIKIIQRLPVRIGLDPAELKQHPLPLGLSMQVTVDTRDRNGPRLSELPAWSARQETDVYASQERGAEALIDKIVAQNLPAAGTAP